MSKYKQITTRNYAVSFTTNACGGKRNYVKINANASYEHEKTIFDICWELAKNNIEFLTSAKFKGSTKIADILVLDKLFVIEVLCSETDKSFKEHKEGKYPKVFEVFKFYTNKDFDGQITDILALTTQS